MEERDFFSGLEVADISLHSVRFETKADLKPGERTLGIALGHDIRLNPDDGAHVMLVLNVGVNVDVQEDFEERGFLFEASVAGIFGADQLESDDERKAFVLVNGLSLLYAEARSYLAQFSANSPLGKVLLPSVNMLSYLRALEPSKGDSDVAEDCVSPIAGTE